MSAPIKGYYIINLREVNPEHDKPDAGFLFLYPKNGKWYTKNNAGEETELGADSDLLHVQNTDFKLGRHLERITSSGFIDMTTAPYNVANYIAVGERQDPQTGEFWVSFITANDPVNPTSVYDAYFFVVNEWPDATVKINHAEGNQLIPDEQDLVLQQGDWALCKGGVIGPSGEYYTMIIASNKLVPGAAPTGSPAPTSTPAPSEVSTDFEPTVLLDGTQSTGITVGTEIDLSGTWVLDEMVGNYLVLTYGSLTEYSPIIKTAHEITGNSTAGVFTLKNEIEYAATGAAWEIFEPHTPDVSVDNIIAAVMVNNAVIKVPTFTPGDERNSLIIYREGASGSSTRACFVFLEDPVLGVNMFQIFNDGELIKLAAHNYGTKHWDELGSNNRRTLVDIHIDAVTTNTGYSNSDYESVKATSWDLGVPIRFTARELTDGSSTITFKGRKSRSLEFTANMEVRQTNSNPDVTCAFQKSVNGGTTWTTIERSEISVALSTALDIDTLSVNCVVEFNYGDMLRVVNKVTGGNYIINKCNIFCSYPES